MSLLMGGSVRSVLVKAGQMTKNLTGQSRLMLDGLLLFKFLQFKFSGIQKSKHKIG